MASHAPYVWHLLHYTRHNILALWHQATILMTPHPLYLTSYILNLCHHTHCLGNSTPTEFLRSHLLYMMTSYPLYMTSLPLNVCHHTHFFNGITPIVYRTSHPLYVSYHIHCIKHYLNIFYDITPLYLWDHMHSIHDITPTISEMASTISVSSRLYWWSQTNSMYDITPTLRMPAYALYTTSHPLFMTLNHCSYHITSTAFMTSHTLYMTSHTWQYKCYICHLTNYI